MGGSGLEISPSQMEPRILYSRELNFCFGNFSRGKMLSRIPVSVLVRSRPLPESTAPFLSSRLNSTLSENSEPLLKKGEPSSLGLNAFLKKVYLRSAAGMGVSLVAGMAAMPFVATMPFHLLGLGSVVGIGSCLALGKLKSTPIHSPSGIQSQHSLLREGCFWGLCAGLGVAAAPAIAINQALDPMALPLALGLSTTIFGGCAIASTRIQDSTLMQWKAPLAVGLGTLLGTQVIGLAALMMVGPCMISSISQSVDLYGGLALFTALSIYDSYLARQNYAEGEADDIGCATSLYLDWFNLLIRIQELLISRKD